MAGLTRDAPTPTEIPLHQKSRVLEIAFSDGKRFRLPREFLRVYSPSAEVRPRAGTGGAADRQEGRRDHRPRPGRLYAVRPVPPTGTIRVSRGITSTRWASIRTRCGADTGAASPRSASRRRKLPSRRHDRNAQQQPHCAAIGATCCRVTPSPACGAVEGRSMPGFFRDRKETLPGTLRQLPVRHAVLIRAARRRRDAARAPLSEGRDHLRRGRGRPDGLRRHHRPRADLPAGEPETGRSPLESGVVFGELHCSTRRRAPRRRGRWRTPRRSPAATSKACSTRMR